MSIKVMARVWESSLPTGTHKFVLLSFADYANDDGRCWPSIGRIAHRSQMSRRQVQRVVGDLKRMGLLDVVEPPVGKRTPMYLVRGDKLTPLADYEVTFGTSRGDISDLGVTSEVLGVTSATSRGDTHVTQTVREPSLRTITLNPPVEPQDFSFFDEWIDATGKPHVNDPRT